MAAKEDPDMTVIPKDAEPTQEPADTLHRHGDPDPSVWEEQPTVTGRPNDKAAENSTFGSRAKGAAKTKAVDDDATENKSMSSPPASKGRGKR